MMNTTYAKQEMDIIQKIIDQADCSEDLEKVGLELHEFEGKHFKHLTTEGLLKRIKDVSTKFRNRELINNYSITEKSQIQKSLITFDVQNKIPWLEKYRQKVEKSIVNEELQSKVKKSNYCRLDETAKVFYFMLPNGAPQVMPLWTERSESNHIFLLFKVLFEHWLENGDQVITKELMRSKLAKLGWVNITDKDISSSIANLRRTKIAPAKLSHYVGIFFGRDNEKVEGYRLEIVYP